MAESLKKEIKEFRSSLEVTSKPGSVLSPVFICCSENSFEFDQIIDFYKKRLSEQGEPFEVVVFVSEPGDAEKLFSEIFNLSMFSSKKLIIIKSGSDFFKPLLTSAKKEYFDNFKRSISGFQDNTFILIHYDAKDAPQKLYSMFNNKFSLLKSKNFYPDETRRKLEEILESEKISFDPAAIDEFIHKTPPNTGAYSRNIKKLQSYLGKKHYVIDDIKEILFNTNEYNPFNLADLVFKNNKHEFLKEFSKFRPESDSLLSLLTILLNRLDEIRKAKIIFKRLGDNDDSKFFEILGFTSYSEARKKFTKSRLKKETRWFNDKSIEFFYDFLIEMNIRIKSGSIREGLDFVFIRNIEKLFLLLAEG
ncbi:MAG: DNA polymerase III subunit delta [Leptospira sp.]|nr:DNA polymerase III subunit delta [Leptospira sp.]